MSVATATVNVSFTRLRTMRLPMAVTRRTLLWLSERQQAQRLITRVPVTWRVAGRFVAGETTRDAVEAVRALNAAGLGGILNLLGEGVTDRPGTEVAVAGYREAIDLAREAAVRTVVSPSEGAPGPSLRLRWRGPADVLCGAVLFDSR